MKRILTVLLLMAFMATSAPAQDNERNEGPQPLMTYVRVDGRPCVASTAEEFIILTHMVRTVNELRRKKATGKIDGTEYTNRVSAMLKDAELKGVRVN